MQNSVLKTSLVILTITLFIASSVSQEIPLEIYQKNTQTDEVEIIVYTANQDWPSKSWIYLLTTQGIPITYYEYDWFIFNDVEVVNNEVYVTDWIAPRLYKVDILTGDLTVIIDDWSLFSMYDVAFDGTFFYINEWSLNRYTINGVKDSQTSFPYNVRGSAWDGTYYWTLLNTTEIKCWDISNWPNLTEIPENNFFPPTASCRGLWHDGNYFWTAERVEGGTGFIYQFDNNGTIINQIPEPISKGYAACYITLPNQPPQTPETPQGPNKGDTSVSYSFNTSTIDPDNDDVYYQWDWDDNHTSPWIGPYPSGITIEQTHSWENSGIYQIRVRARDFYGSMSSWSEPHTIIIGNNPPETPIITGPSNGKSGVTYLYSTSTTDPDDDLVYYIWDYGDGNSSDWMGPYPSGQKISTTYMWSEEGTYIIRVKAKDIYGLESDWGILEVKMPLNTQLILQRIFNKFQSLLYIIYQ
ncbi:MAG: PKD domain-containing protein [Thermoplasmatota archaeon]